MLKLGLNYTSTLSTTIAVSASTIGSGELEVFSTPSMIALMENAAMNAVKPFLSLKESTVGGFISIKHLRPTKIGDFVEATATLAKIEERKLTFNVIAKDSQGIIGEGSHVRFIIDVEKFLKKIL